MACRRRRCSASSSVEHDGELLSFSIQRLLPGRSLDELAGELPASDLERLVMDGGELLARVHSVVPDRGIRHELQLPDERSSPAWRASSTQALGPAAATVVERGADFLREQVMTRPAPSLSLAHGDWLPKHLLIDDGAIVGVIDWEFAGPASPAFDFARGRCPPATPCTTARTCCAAGMRGSPIPTSADAGWVPAFAIDWALEKLGWENPAPPAQQRRCVDVIARYAAA